MKNFLILCFFIPLIGSAQIGFKVEAGPVLSDFNSSLKNPNLDIYRKYIGYQVQGLAGFQLSNKLQLETGLAFIQRGTTSESDLIFIDDLIEINNNQPFDLIRRSNFEHQLELPFRLNMFFKEIEKGLFLTVGVRPSLILNSKSKVTFISDGKRNTEGAKNDPFGAGKKFNLFGRLSLGYALPFEKLKLNISTYFDHQILNSGFDGTKYYVHSFGALLGWRF